MLFLLAALLVARERAEAADSLETAAHQIAAKIKAQTTSADSFRLSITSRLQERRAPAEAPLRSALDAALRAHGVGLADKMAPSGEISITISEDARGFLLVAKVQRGEEIRIVMSPFEFIPEPPGQKNHIEKTLIWEQESPILDVEWTESELWVLEPDALSFYTRRDGQWVSGQRLSLTHSRPWPLDKRGLLEREDGLLVAYLPGISCRVQGVTPQILCEEAETQWPLRLGSVSLRASFEPGRNLFSGMVTMGGSTRKYIAPFYSAAVVPSEGKEAWFVARPDGHAYLYSQFPETELRQDRQAVLDQKDARELQPIPGWGSDIVVANSGCLSHSLVLSTGSGDAGPDVIRAHAVVKHRLEEVSAPLQFPGLVTALWPAANGTARAVVHDAANGRYAAYGVDISCERQTPTR